MRDHGSFTIHVQGKVSAYVNYCLVLLEQRRARFVALKAMGRAIVKVSFDGTMPRPRSTIVREHPFR